MQMNSWGYLRVIDFARANIVILDCLFSYLLTHDFVHQWPVVATGEGLTASAYENGGPEIPVLARD